jgi:hypothetical protein
MAEKVADPETAGSRGRKVFFLYPHSVLNEDLLIEILSNEYEIYGLRDHETAAKLAAVFGGSIFFVNIDEALKGLLWEAWIRRIMSTPATASARIGIMTYNPDPELARKYLMEIGIPCGFIQLKLGLAEGKAIILRTLEANEARGRRRYVRAQFSDQRQASFNVTIRGAHVTGAILDISIAGMSFRLDSTVHLKPQEVLDDVQLRMKGTLCKVRGSYAGAAQGGADRSLLMFHTPMPEDAGEKIHRFIFMSLQEEMSDFVRSLRA